VNRDITVLFDEVFKRQLWMNESVRSEGGMILTRGSCSWRKKISASDTFSSTGISRTGLGFNSDLLDERLATNRLSYDYGLPVTTLWLLTSSGFMHLHDADIHM
jgi:hypothetical protein